LALRVMRMSERVPPCRGGKEIHVAALTRAQVEAGHDVQLLYRCGQGEDLASSTIRVELPRPVADIGGLVGTAWFSATAARRAKGLVPPDIVHLHGDIAEAWFMKGYARWADATAVLTVHGGLNPRYFRLASQCFTGIDAFIALGDRVRDDLLQCGVPHDRITVMSSGLNAGLLATAEIGVTRVPGRIVTVGSLDAVKNHATVIRAVLEAPESAEMTLDIIGEGRQRRELEALAAGSRRVQFWGQLARAEVYRRVAKADAFVIASKRLPSKGEGIPTSLLEAMALGRLALVSTSATPRPVVADDDSYRTFDPDDHRELANLLVQAVGDSAMRTQFGERARRAVAHLTWPEVARHVDDVYEAARSRRWKGL
jgi:glycosyltransferase involved in cell wall biosynthesis